MRIDLNSDVGELEDATVDERMMPLITSANIACGAHAGDVETMERTIRLALAARVAVGAHPGYPDRENFGRVEIPMSALEIETAVFEQVTALADIAARCGARVQHVKPHGALYNVAVNNAEVARAVGLGVALWSRNVVLVGLAGSTMLKVWRDLGFPVAAEGFADRRYEPDGTLRPRRFPDALITDPAEAGRQAVALAGQVETICIHGDTPGAPAIAEAVRAALRKAGVEAASIRGTSSSLG
jgi:UPF0271 protein